MRARNLKPGFFKNEELGELTFEERLLFAGLWCLADREGFFENRPKRIAAEIFPFDEKITGSKISKMLCNLMSRHVITLNDTHGFIPSFKKHNNPHPHEAKSTVSEEIKKTLTKQCNKMSLHCNDISRQSRAESPLMNHESPLMNHESLLMTHDSSPTDTFEEFYSIYPRKEAKEVALKCWKKLDLSNGLFEIIIKGLKNQLPLMSKKEKKFIPLPGSWLNQKRWQDEVKETDNLTSTQRAILENRKRRIESGEQDVNGENTI